MGDFIGQVDFAKYAAATAFLARDPSSLTEIDSIDPEQSLAITDLIGSSVPGQVAPDCALLLFETGQFVFQEVRSGAAPGVTEASPATFGAGEMSFTGIGTSDSPFEYLEAASDALTQLRILTAAFRLVSKLPYRKRLGQRIASLIYAVAIEDTVGDLRSVISLRSLLQFLEDNPRFRYPTVVLTPDLHFRALWRNGPDAHLAIEFTSEGHAIFVVFSRDPYRKDLIRRATGVASKESVIDVLRPFRFERWAMT